MSKPYIPEFEERILLHLRAIENLERKGLVIRVGFDVRLTDAGRAHADDLTERTRRRVLDDLIAFENDKKASELEKSDV
jgi:Mn-dependent DtxR family transcriptional regulator